MSKKRKKPPARNSSAISKTDKTITSDQQVEHLDPHSKTHEHDVKQTAEWWAKKQGIQSEREVTDKQLEEALDASGIPFSSDPTSLFLGFSAIEKSLDLRKNLCLEDGIWTIKKGADWKKFIIKNLKERETYKTSAGAICRAVQKKYQSPLRAMFCRLPPWMASELSASNTPDIDKAICQFAEKFSEKTGYPILAVNVHKESPHDLHIHVVYSDVIAVTKKKKLTKKEKRAIMVQKRKEVRQELKDNRLPAHNSDITTKMETMDIQIPEFKGEAHTEYLKIMRFGKSKPNWPQAKRKMHILGSPYRYKGQIWEAAKSKRDKDAIRLFREWDRSSAKSFSKRLCFNKNPEKDYVDWWAEQELQRHVLGVMTENIKQRVESSKAQAVTNYIQYGKSVISIEEAVLADRAAELDKKEAVLADRVAELDKKEEYLKKRAEWLDGVEQGLGAYEKAVEETISRLSDDRAIFEGDKLELKGLKDSLSEKKSELRERQNSLKKDCDALAEEKEIVDLAKEKAKKIRSDQDKREGELADRETQRDQKDEELKGEGRNEVLKAMTAKLWPEENLAAKTSSDRVANYIKKKAHNPKPKTLEQISSKLGELLSEASKFHLLAKVVRQFTGRIIKSSGVPDWLIQGSKKLIAIIDGTDSTQPKDTNTPEQ